MSIGFIEQEILDGNVSRFWLPSCSNEYGPLDLQTDLQADDEGEIGVADRRNNFLGNERPFAPMRGQSQEIEP